MLMIPILFQKGESEIRSLLHTAACCLNWPNVLKIRAF